MTAFSFAKSEAEDWPAAARELVAGLGEESPDDAGEPLGWLYVTDAHADNCGGLLACLRQKTGVETWAGSVGMGVCWRDGRGACGEAFGRPAALAMVGRHPAGSFQVLPRLAESVSEIPEPARQWMGARTPPFGVVHGDPMNAAVPGLIEALSSDMENPALAAPGFLVGGLTSSRGAHHQIAGDVTGGGLSGILFSPEVEVATGLTQGYAPVGPAHRITECMENVVMTLNGAPALTVFKQDIGDLLARDLARAAGHIHAAFPVTGSDTGDYVVRNLNGIDPERGWLAVGGEVDVGDRLMFVRRDPDGVEQDLARMAEELAGRLPGPARGGLYFSCVARGPGLFGAEGREMEIIGETLDDIPLVGFFGQGEISNNRLYGYTGVLALFL